MPGVVIYVVSAKYDDNVDNDRTGHKHTKIN